MYAPVFRTECRPREVDSDLLPPKYKHLMIFDSHQVLPLSLRQVTMGYSFHLPDLPPGALGWPVVLNPLC